MDAEFEQSMPRKVYNFTGARNHWRVDASMLDRIGYPTVSVRLSSVPFAEIVEWCESRFADTWLWVGYVWGYKFYFTNAEDAVLFSLRWADVSV